MIDVAGRDKERFYDTMHGVHIIIRAIRMLVPFLLNVVLMQLFGMLCLFTTGSSKVEERSNGMQWCVAYDYGSYKCRNLSYANTPSALLQNKHIIYEQEMGVSDAKIHLPVRKVV